MKECIESDFSWEGECASIKITDRGKGSFGILRLVMCPRNKWTLDKNSVGQAIAVCGLSTREYTRQTTESPPHEMECPSISPTLH
jgi:hypothetical protein